MPTSRTISKLPAPAEKRADDFVVPIVHIHLSEPVVNVGFYGGLAAAVVLGAVDLPLAALVGAAVAIARHRRA
jgi:hypothetical protein